MADDSPKASSEDINIEELIPKDVYSLVKHLVVVMAHNAWVYMGLQMNPLSKTVTKDAAQARLAIDCAAALIEKITPFVDEKEKEEFKILIQNLQMNYIQQCGS